MTDNTDTESDRRGRTGDPYQATFTDDGLERQATLDEQDADDEQQETADGEEVMV